MTFNGSYKWVLDGDRFAAVAGDGMTHGEIAEQELGRPGAAADEIERGHLNLVDGIVTYEVYQSDASDPQVELAIRIWVEELTGRAASSVDVAPFAWDFEQYE